MIFPMRVVLYMQVRTRVLDDALLAFVRGGGAQIVLLGAGFDCRALPVSRASSRKRRSSKWTILRRKRKSAMCASHGNVSAPVESTSRWN